MGNKTRARANGGTNEPNNQLGTVPFAKALLVRSLFVTAFPNTETRRRNTSASVPTFAEATRSRSFPRRLILRQNWSSKGKGTAKRDSEEKGQHQAALGQL